MRRQLEVVRLTVDIPSEGLQRGDVGTNVAVLVAPEPAYEVEFIDEYGQTVSQVALLPEQVETWSRWQVARRTRARRSAPSHTKGHL